MARRETIRKELEQLTNHELLQDGQRFSTRGVVYESRMSFSKKTGQLRGFVVRLSRQGRGRGLS